MRMKLVMIRTYFGVSSMLTPKKAAEKSFLIFQKVRKKDVRERELSFFREARQFKVQSEMEPIDCFELGDSNGPPVFLVHGWDSNAGSMSRFASELALSGYRVIAFNLPGHAFYRAASTNLLECRNAMNDVLTFVDPKEPFSVVSHSFGSAVVANALATTNFEVDKLVFLTNPNKIEDIFFEFKGIVGLRTRAYKVLIRRASQLLGAPIQTLDVSANLNKVNFQKLLLIHDQYDQVLPHSNSFQINSDHKNVQLISLEKVGHYKMLWNDEVINRTVAFVKGKQVM